MPKQHVKAILLSVALLFTAIVAKAQNGTYYKKCVEGAYGVISLHQTGNKVQAEIFAWWNSASAQMGSYTGEGVLKNNTVVLHSEENEPGCKVTLSIVQGKVRALFANCSTDHLTDDFNGTYSKITDAVAGDYAVTIPKAYFYKTPDKGSQLKAYVLRGDKVRLDIDRIAASKQNWVYVYFTNKAGKETAGFMPLTNLKRVE